MEGCEIAMNNDCQCKLGKISHLGIAVKSIEDSLKLYTDVFGLKLAGTEVVPEQKVKVAFLPVGESRIELLEATEPDSPVAKFIENKGEGIQHIAFQVENVEKAIEAAKELGMRMIDEKPRKGAGGARIAFMHPKSTYGVLIELCEHSEDHD
jgi:methylmalonyl-CoA/ethylmalonyl-CoA epimerase